MATRILPLELIDKAIGSQLWILMRGKTEVVGTLRGFDDYVCCMMMKIVIVWYYDSSDSFFVSLSLSLSILGQFGVGRCGRIFSRHGRKVCQDGAT
jgi:small nuclear ribonucleoprotein (snRNP)-like protein